MLPVFSLPHSPSKYFSSPLSSLGLLLNGGLFSLPSFLHDVAVLYHSGKVEVLDVLVVIKQKKSRITKQVKRLALRPAGCPISIKPHHLHEFTENMHPLIDDLLQFAHLLEEIGICISVSLLNAFSYAKGRLDSL